MDTMKCSKCEGEVKLDTENEGTMKCGMCGDTTKAEGDKCEGKKCEGDKCEGKKCEGESGEKKE